ncbi:MAG TPA: citrate/2-methylcitrate synthase [Thermoanaerobaculia bacterium]|nr:citrate/2-methylcitrate synthase [Thermoanaerobaculia bacterium]
MTDEPGTGSYLTADQAAGELGVSVSTLYAYVSRGLLASEPIPGSRSRRYARREVERLKRRRRVRRDPSRAGEGSLAWGEPVVDSAVTLIDGERLWYRGQDAVELADAASFEEVAALLWTGDREAAGELFAEPWPRLDGAAAQVAAKLGRAAPIERCQAILPLAGAADPSGWDLRPAAVTASGVRILRLVTLLAAGVGEPPDGEDGRPGGVAATLAAGWGVDAPQAVAAIEQTLVLCADHELNVSAFTARCVASAAGSPYDAVAAALAAIKGARHGGLSERVEALLAEVGERSRARRVLADRLRRGEAVPGFGHPLYPAGDPRAARLLELAGKVAADRDRLDVVRAVVAAGRDLLGEEAVLDYGLVALRFALDLPPGAPLALFAVGRTAGWIGQAIEEYGRGELIRPRARYVGPAPEKE